MSHVEAVKKILAEVRQLEEENNLLALELSKTKEDQIKKRNKEAQARLAALKAFCDRTLSSGPCSDTKRVETHSDSKGETILDYWKNTYLFQSEAKVVAFESVDTKAGPGLALTLDRTIFHPQGGGQPSDTGSITTSSGEMFLVSHVAKVGSFVKHHGQVKSGSSAAFPVGEKVILKVDEEPRRLHARFHSGGHLLDVAVEEAGFKLNATKGHHAPQGSYVEYEGVIEEKQKPEFIAKVQTAVNRLIKEKRSFHVKIVDYSELATALGGAVPAYLPKDKSARVVTIDGSVGCPCGGTHVQNTEEIRELKITKVQTKKQNVQIKYTLG